MATAIQHLKAHDGSTEWFVCRDCMTQIDPVGHNYPGYTEEQCDDAECPLCGGTDTAWLFATDEEAIALAIAKADDASSKVLEQITTYTACVYGKNGDEPGAVEINLECAEVDLDDDSTVTLYRWIEQDDGGIQETGEWTNDKSTAIEGGEEYASDNDETPDLDSLISEIEETGFFKDNDIIPAVIKSATQHSQGYLLVTPDISEPIGTMWTTNGYLQRDDYISLDATYPSEAYAADALLRAINDYQSGDND